MRVVIAKAQRLASLDHLKLKQKRQRNGWNVLITLRCNRIWCQRSFLPIKSHKSSICLQTSQANSQLNNLFRHSKRGKLNANHMQTLFKYTIQQRKRMKTFSTHTEKLDCLKVLQMWSKNMVVQVKNRSNVDLISSYLFPKWGSKAKIQKIWKSWSKLPNLQGFNCKSNKGRSKWRNEDREILKCLRLPKIFVSPLKLWCRTLETCKSLHASSSESETLQKLLTRSISILTSRWSRQSLSFWYKTVTHLLYWKIKWTRCSSWMK